uniref:UPAR/Ly6 domain-containing protein n=1 Tax=Sphaeramia orbicularis TaxID=375764 RepID=A0A673AVW4_9TELE
RGGKEITRTVLRKGCDRASRCFEKSVNFGTLRVAFTTKCCTTDLCNEKSASPCEQCVPNGKKCFGCDGTEFCNQTLDCVDDEDHCFTYTGKQPKTSTILRTKGCITKKFCQTIQLAELIQTQTIGMTCCQGDYCNRADSTGSSLLLLVVTGFSLVIFS